MAAGLLLLLLRASSGLRHTLSDLVSHLLCALYPEPSPCHEEARFSLTQTGSR
jgi:hypothetical protein